MRPKLSNICLRQCGQAWIVRLPLSISACVNASAPPFGGSGLTQPFRPGFLLLSIRPNADIRQKYVSQGLSQVHKIDNLGQIHHDNIRAGKLTS